MQTHRNGAASVTSLTGDGLPSLALSSNQRLRHPEAKIEAGAKAVYSALMNGIANFDTATDKLRHKSRQIALAVLEAVDRFENQQ